MTWLFSILGIGGIGAALFFIPGAIPAVIGAFSALLGRIRRSPWPCAVIALCGACVWLWLGWNHANDQRDTWHRAYTAQKSASDAAGKAQKALNAQRQQTYQEKSDVAQERHVARADRVRSVTSEFISANRLQPGQCPPSGSNPAPGASGAPVPADAPGSAVMVAERDVDACAADYAYARSAFEWADSLLKAGVAH